MNPHRPSQSSQTQPRVAALRGGSFAAFGLLAALLLAACQPGRTYVLSPASSSVRYSGVSIREVGATATVQDDDKRRFEERLTQLLHQDGGFSNGEDLCVRYRIIYHDPGSGLVRIGATAVSLLGVPVGALGWGMLSLDVVYTDAAGAELAHIIADGPIDGPFASSRSGLETAAASIAEFARTNFAVKAGATTTHAQADRTAP